MDNAEKNALAVEPNRHDSRAGERTHENECAAERAGVGVRDRDLRRPRRRNIDRAERARHRLSSKLGEGMGSGSVESRGVGNPRGARTVWDYFGARRRRAAKDDAAVQGWR